MAYVPSATANRTPPQKDNRNTVYAILIAIILLLLGYIVYDKTQDKKTEQLNFITVQNLDSAKSVLQAEFEIASKQVDTLTANNTQLETKLSEKNSELAKTKASINSILKQKNISVDDLKKAQKLIAEYKGQLEGLQAEVAKLKGENLQLTADKQQLTTDKNQLATEKEQLSNEKNQLTTEKKNLEDKVDVASTLTASHINITAIKMRGDKEKETETAKRADFFRLSFVLDENRVAASGKKSLYVVVTSPDGKTSVPNGSFKTRDGIELQYTETIDVNYEQGKVLPVSFDWKPGTQFIPGDYKIEIYNNGFKIGETKKSMKKGGLFS
jgi:myosin heavy subunit